MLSTGCTKLNNRWHILLAVSHRVVLYNIKFFEIYRHAFYQINFIKLQFRTIETPPLNFQDDDLHKREEPRRSNQTKHQLLQFADAEVSNEAKIKIILKKEQKRRTRLKSGKSKKARNQTKDLIKARRLNTGEAAFAEFTFVLSTSFLSYLIEPRGMRSRFSFRLKIAPWNSIVYVIN